MIEAGPLRTRISQMTQKWTASVLTSEFCPMFKGILSAARRAMIRMGTHTIHPFNPGLELCQPEMYLNAEHYRPVCLPTPSRLWLCTTREW